MSAGYLVNALLPYWNAVVKMSKAKGSGPPSVTSRSIVCVPLKKKQTHADQGTRKGEESCLQTRNYKWRCHTHQGCQNYDPPTKDVCHFLVLVHRLNNDEIFEYKDAPNNMYLVITADSLNEIGFLTNFRHCISFP